MYLVFAKAMALGFAVAAPVGPISLLCMQRTLTVSRMAGLATGFGIAVADAFYAGVAAAGISIIADFLIAQARWLTLGGGALLALLAIQIYKAEPSHDSGRAAEGRLIQDFLGALVLTLANPLTVLALVAAFAALGLAEEGGGWQTGVLLVAGVFTGSTLWWIAVVGGIGLIRHQFTPRILRWFNRAAGTILAVFGVLAIARGAL